MGDSLLESTGVPIYWLDIVKGGLLIAKAQKMVCHWETTTTVGYLAGINHQGQGLDFDDHRAYFDEYRSTGRDGIAYLWKEREYLLESWLIFWIEL